MFLPTSAASAATQSPSAFPAFLARAVSRGTRPRPLDYGIDETALIRYADGAVSDDGERALVEHFVLRDEWCHQFVVNRVKQRRKNKKVRNAA